MAVVIDGNNLSTTGVINSGTAVNSTSGTSIDFTGIPAGVKRITVMFNGVSTNGSSFIEVRIGSGSFSATGYISGANYAGASASGTSYNSTTGFLFDAGAPNSTAIRYGQMVVTLLGSNTWVSSSVMTLFQSSYFLMGGGGVSPALSGALDRVRITTNNGTDTFDAGSINILYE